MLKNYLVAKNFDLMKVNPFVRKVNKIFTNWENHNVPLRELYDFAMFVVLEGELNFNFDDKHIELKVGEILIMPPFVVHKESIKHNHAAKYFVVNFDLFYYPERANWRMQDMYLNYCRSGIVKMAVNPHYMIKDDNANVFDLPIVMKIKNINSIVELLQKMYEINIRTLIVALSKEDHMCLKAYMLEILSLLFQMEEVKEENTYRGTINKFIEFVLENYNLNFDINNKAIELGFSPNYFRKIFKQEIGVTPFEYLLKLRISEAKILLAKDMSVRKTAEKVGFADSLYFRKVFKKQVGLSPTAYKNSILDNPKFDVY